MTKRLFGPCMILLSMAMLARSGWAQDMLSAPATAPANTYDVRTFGAIGDGVTKDTAAFQKALDTCVVNGGGEVLAPAGRYLIGSLQMGNRTILRLEKETVLVGSPDAADYPSMSIRWEGRWQQGRRAPYLCRRRRSHRHRRAGSHRGECANGRPAKPSRVRRSRTHLLHRCPLGGLHHHTGRHVGNPPDLLYRRAHQKCQHHM